MSRNKVSVNHECEALGCANKSQIELPIRVGEKGTIVLRLCNDCVVKFGG